MLQFSDNPFNQLWETIWWGIFFVGQTCGVWYFLLKAAEKSNTYFVQARRVVLLHKKIRLVLYPSCGWKTPFLAPTGSPWLLWNTDPPTSFYSSKISTPSTPPLHSRKSASLGECAVGDGSSAVQMDCWVPNAQPFFNNHWVCPKMRPTNLPWNGHFLQSFWGDFSLGDPRVLRLWRAQAARNFRILAGSGNGKRYPLATVCYWKWP